jgi:hypothetical protein
MFSFVASRLVPAACIGALLAAASVAVAQTAPTPSTPKRDPLNAAEAVPPIQHRSAIANYRRHAEQPVGSWREANDTVTRIGGWRAYAREANQPEAPAATPAPAAPAASSPAAAKPAPAGHAGHIGHSKPAKP